MEGTLIKGIAGFYYVWTEEAIYECKARGKFRNKGLTPMVGDKVIVSLDPSSTASNPSMKAGTVDEILPRHNELERPPISNVDICIIVTAAKDPVPLTYIIDRMSVAALLKECEIVICINKADLDEAKAEELKSIYETLFPVVIASTKTGQGMEDLKRLLLGKQAALCGPSGVGKSSLTNKLLGEGINAITGEISEKTLRGKNTTRHSELFAGDGFFLFDTPGFTAFEAPELEEADLAAYFPEFEQYLGKCRFDNCRHLSEPECAIKENVGKTISKSRYTSYKEIYKEISERRKY